MFCLMMRHSASYLEGATQYHEFYGYWLGGEYDDGNSLREFLSLLSGWKKLTFWVSTALSAVLPEMTIMDYAPKTMSKGQRIPDGFVAPAKLYLMGAWTEGGLTIKGECIISLCKLVYTENEPQDGVFYLPDVAEPTAQYYEFKTLNSGWKICIPKDMTATHDVVVAMEQTTWYETDFLLNYLWVFSGAIVNESIHFLAHITEIPFYNTIPDGALHRKFGQPFYVISPYQMYSFVPDRGLYFDAIGDQHEWKLPIKKSASALPIIISPDSRGAFKSRSRNVRGLMTSILTRLSAFTGDGVLLTDDNGTTLTTDTDEELIT